MTVRTIDDIFRDFATDGVPASGPFNPHKPDIRDTLKALTEGGDNFPDNRVIRLNNADAGTANNIVVTASVTIPAAAYQVLFILNVTKENTGAVTVSGALNRTLVTNVSQPIPSGYLTPGMALLCIDTGTELRLLSYGDADAIQAAAEAAADRAELAAAEAVEAAAGLNLPVIQPGDAGKSLIVNDAEDGYELGSSIAGEYDTRSKVEEANVPETSNFLRTAGYYAAGDGGGALYKRTSTQPTHAGKIQSADGAWWEISKNSHNPLAFGAKGDGVTDDANAINSTIIATKLAIIPRGAFRTTSQIIVDNTTITGETETGPQGATIRGQDARQTIILPTAAVTAPAILLKYGLGSAAHSMHKFEDFSVVGTNQNGIRVENAAYLRMNSISVRGSNTALHLESVLSSSFKDLRLDANRYGVLAGKGAGYSHPNANSFENCIISGNSQLGYGALSAHHNLNVSGGAFESNGTQGDDTTGGMFLTFDGGVEGAVGANIRGVYFEGNGGQADLRLENTGANYVTVVVEGCNFNRTSAAKYTRQNIAAIGRINLVLIGNAFRGYNNYVEDAARPYLYKDSLVRLINIGNYCANAVAGTSMLSSGNLGTVRGSVSAAGVGISLPNGWTAVKASTGIYTITHNLGATDIYSPLAISTSGDPYRVQRSPKNANFFQVVTENSTGTLIDCAFDFHVTIG